jgi:hypothetical protein
MGWTTSNGHWMPLLVSDSPHRTAHIFTGGEEGGGLTFERPRGDRANGRAPWDDVNRYGRTNATSKRAAGTDPIRSASLAVLAVFALDYS